MPVRKVSVKATFSINLSPNNVTLESVVARMTNCVASCGNVIREVEMS